MRLAVLMGCLITAAARLAAADDSAALTALFAPAHRNGGGAVTIPPGDYTLTGERLIRLPSRTTVRAYGARFHLPERLGDKARLVFFAGSDLEDFAWHGGEFVGHVFDPDRQTNFCEPNANTRVFLLITSEAGRTRDVCFRDVRASDVPGAVITVTGLLKPQSESDVLAYAHRVTVENCTLLRSGKFMWDYGYLWQQIVWPEDYQPWEVERAWGYFRRDLIRGGLRMEAGDDRVQFDNAGAKPIKVSAKNDPAEALGFFGGTLPKNVVRGRQYFVVESRPEYVKIADAPGGQPIKFDGAAGDGVKLIHNLMAAYLALYAPEGAGPGKGAVDIVGCRDVRVTGCRLSALGDTMHVQRCQNVVFANNQITGSRMGAFFLAEYCKNATITGNTVDGTNGSRVMSVEKSCEDVTITGNTFRNGGRGSWINQPKNLVMTGNVFVNNTTKNAPDPRTGRRSFLTGDYETKPELYFTLHEKGGAYGPVIVRDNVFSLGGHVGAPAVTFAGGGGPITFKDNAFRRAGGGKEAAVIRLDPACADVDIRDNPGATLERAPVDFNHGRR